LHACEIRDHARDDTDADHFRLEIGDRKTECETGHRPAGAQRDNDAIGAGQQSISHLLAQLQSGIHLTEDAKWCASSRRHPVSATQSSGECASVRADHSALDAIGARFAGDSLGYEPRRIVHFLSPPIDNRARAELARVDHGREHVRGARRADGDDTLSESHTTEQELERANLVAA